MLRHFNEQKINSINSIGTETSSEDSLLSESLIVDENERSIKYQNGGFKFITDLLGITENTKNIVDKNLTVKFINSFPSDNPNIQSDLYTMNNIISDLLNNKFNIEKIDFSIKNNNKQNLIYLLIQNLTKNNKIIDLLNLIYNKMGASIFKKLVEEKDINNVSALDISKGSLYFTNDGNILLNNTKYNQQNTNKMNPTKTEDVLHTVIPNDSISTELISDDDENFVDYGSKAIKDNTNSNQIITTPPIFKKNNDVNLKNNNNNDLLFINNDNPREFSKNIRDIVDGFQTDDNASELSRDITITFENKENKPPIDHNKISLDTPEFIKYIDQQINNNNNNDNDATRRRRLVGGRINKKYQKNNNILNTLHGKRKMYNDDELYLNFSHYGEKNNEQKYSKLNSRINIFDFDFSDDFDDNTTNDEMRKISRAVQSQKDKLHEEATEKILSQLEKNEDIYMAKAIKAIMYNEIKRLHPELSGLDKIAELLKMITKNKIEEILKEKKLLKEISDHIKNKEKEYQNKEKTDSIDKKQKKSENNSSNKHTDEQAFGLNRYNFNNVFESSLNDTSELSMDSSDYDDDNNDKNISIHDDYDSDETMDAEPNNIEPFSGETSVFQNSSEYDNSEQNETYLQKKNNNLSHILNGLRF